MRKSRTETEQLEDEFIENEDSMDESQKDQIINQQYGDPIDSDLDIHRRNIEPKSQELGFKTNTRDLKMSNFGPATEHFIHMMSNSYRACREKYEVRKTYQDGVELEPIYRPGHGSIFIEVRDGVLIAANSRGGYWQNLQTKREITHHKIEEQINESKPIVVKKNKDDYNY